MLAAAQKVSFCYRLEAVATFLFKIQSYVICVHEIGIFFPPTI